MPRRTLYRRALGWHAPAMRPAVVVMALGVLVAVALAPTGSAEVAVVGGRDVAALSSYAGIDFGDEPTPGYRDFAYLAFTIGMTYQVSDTTLRDPQLRRSVLAHALLSYLFGVVIVSGSVSLITGLLR